MGTNDPSDPSDAARDVTGDSGGAVGEDASHRAESGSAPTDAMGGAEMMPRADAAVDRDAGPGGAMDASSDRAPDVGADISSDAGPPPDFILRPEFSGPCLRATGAIDINRGNAAESFVRAAYCQINGTEPAVDVISLWASELRTHEYVRRIDVARTFCRDAARQCAFTYSDPWSAEVALTARCTRKTSRDLGAVFMFFSDCPGRVNCGMDWANTHALGMATADPLLGFGTTAADYYNAKNPGFWQRELLDARFAGLQFLTLNVYGPDLEVTPDPLAQLGQALAAVGADVKVSLFDDPWAWGKPSSPASWQTPPDFGNAENAAQTLYQKKWKPFYARIARQYWYSFQDRPFVYFYNAGTLGPLSAGAAVVLRMKQLFQQDFGVEPFVAVDGAYFQDDNMATVADARFTWDTLSSGRKSRYTVRGVTLDHFMPKWDALGRDKPGVIATSTDKIIKGTTLLEQMLSSSVDAQIAVVATWNDLGEGTGIERNYDYYVGGAWLAPNAFMSLTRAAQCAP